MAYVTVTGPVGAAKKKEEVGRNVTETQAQPEQLSTALTIGKISRAYFHAVKRLEGIFRVMTESDMGDNATGRNWVALRIVRIDGKGGHFGVDFLARRKEAKVPPLKTWSKDAGEQLREIGVDYDFTRRFFKASKGKTDEDNFLREMAATGGDEWVAEGMFPTSYRDKLGDLEKRLGPENVLKKEYSAHGEVKISDAHELSVRESPDFKNPVGPGADEDSASGAGGGAYVSEGQEVRTYVKEYVLEKDRDGNDFMVRYIADDCLGKLGFSDEEKAALAYEIVARFLKKQEESVQTPERLD